MGLLSPNELLVAVGDHEHDGANSPELFPQDDTTSYGKTILINLTDFSHQQFSKGHRNPQGLFIDSPDAIWETEHGPQGGDELNLVKRGANYGWPSVTYGTQYGAHFWPGDPVPGSHSGYAEPFYSWVPSIGVSSLLVIHSPQFKLWEGDVVDRVAARWRAVSGASPRPADRDDGAHAVRPPAAGHRPRV